MLNALLIDHELESIKYLTTKLQTFYPNINICGECLCLDTAYKIVSKCTPELIFIEATISKSTCFNFISDNIYENHEIIITSFVTDYAIRAVQQQVCGYLLKPIQDDALSVAMNIALKRTEQRERKKRDNFLIDKVVNAFSSSETIGIPTIEGLEFVPIKDIIRCEGLQKCTRVIVYGQKDFISSYNIGAFNKMLCGFGFFSTHKSHLINLRHIKRYLREGTVIMKDNSIAPVAKRRKKEFIDLLVHI